MVRVLDPAARARPGGVGGPGGGQLGWSFQGCDHVKTRLACWGRRAAGDGAGPEGAGIRALALSLRSVARGSGQGAVRETYRAWGVALLARIRMEALPVDFGSGGRGGDEVEPHDTRVAPRGAVHGDIRRCTPTGIGICCSPLCQLLSGSGGAAELPFGARRVARRILNSPPWEQVAGRRAVDNAGREGKRNATDWRCCRH